jgi:hypothetical protein
MDAGRIAKAVLAEHTAATLAARGAVYVADISKMPGLVSRLIAIPRMRRRPYPVLLDREALTIRRFPATGGRVTAVHLAEGRITAIEQLDSEATLRAALALPADEVSGGGAEPVAEPESQHEEEKEDQGDVE